MTSLENACSDINPDNPEEGTKRLADLAGFLRECIGCSGLVVVTVWNSPDLDQTVRILAGIPANMSVPVNELFQVLSMAHQAVKDDLDEIGSSDRPTSPLN